MDNRKGEKGKRVYTRRKVARQYVESVDLEEGAFRVRNGMHKAEKIQRLWMLLRRWKDCENMRMLVRF